ncbi:TetR family transcriptional regulator [Nocardioides insulae]|uniref:TetR family transcriptional regulator n=1 Tax=Nocardioides insulae TaxID=394734 RepID=UPI0004076AE7|nr:TetR family transcriptional regulator [Nocardioides insulae]
MGYHRADVIGRAVDVLDSYGLADLTMRRLGQELGVQPSALYHHFANKQTLLAAVADEILRRGARPVAEGPWEVRVAGIAANLREALLGYRDGAELVSTVRAFDLGARAPYDDLAAALAGGGVPEGLVPTAAGTVLHFVLGHTLDEQTHLQAGSAGAIEDDPREGSDFELGVALIVGGIRAHVGQITL